MRVGPALVQSRSNKKLRKLVVKAWRYSQVYGIIWVMRKLNKGRREMNILLRLWPWLSFKTSRTYPLSDTLIWTPDCHWQLPDQLISFTKHVLNPTFSQEERQSQPTQPSKTPLVSHPLDR